jgi:uncharacterized circularly permuted ATP-grasp superfamily protein/uncharacterized alpha-E superfamily protein
MNAPPQLDTPPLAQSYRAPGGAFDEVVDPEGRVRAHWRKLLTLLGGLDATQIARRTENARQLVHQNGVSYDVYGDSPGLAHPWTLSLVPAVMSAEDFRELERGIAQRARLLRAVIADLYGPQRTLMERLLPPELVFRHPWFLTPAHRVRVAADNWLPVYAADVVRAPDGRFFALEDRTQSPTGAGYALENRVVISSALPDLFRECNIERLALFFRSLKDVLTSAAPHNRDNPRIALLTPGPNDATYFEHAYLAQYLGITLVSGGDLTVRDERVYLKTLGGLLQIDVILRRSADDSADPLELRPDSPYGVPGLMQAVRAGNVAVMNPLGSGVLQSIAVLPYLPALSLRLLGEELLLPSVQSYWCGDPKMLDEVTAKFARIVVRPAFPDTGVSAVFTEELTEAQRAELLAKIRAEPAKWAAQDYVAPSITPALLNGSLVPQSLVSRVFAASRGAGEYTVMPGGLARAGDTGADVSMRLGGGSKDLWVISLEAASGPSVVTPSQHALELSRGGGDLPSRAADNLYWLGRYTERAESLARLSRVVGARLADLANQGELELSTEIAPLFSALEAQMRFLYSADIPQHAALELAGSEKKLLENVAGADAGSLTSVVRSTLRAGRLVRDLISNDTWRVLAALEDDVNALTSAQGPDRLNTTVTQLHRVVMTLAAFSGLASESMTRGHAWRFLDVGRRLERAMALVTLLRATVARSIEREAPLLEAVLTIADSVMTYRRRYLARLQVAPVVDLLLTDDSNPRSVIYQVRALADHIRALPPLAGAGVRSPQLRLVLAAESELELCEVESICAANETGDRPALDALLRKLGQLLPSLSESLSNSYLNHATVSRHLGQDGS